MYKKILVPIDGSPLSEGVLECASILAKNEDSEIVLLCVAVNVISEFIFGDPGLAKDFIDSQETSTKEYLIRVENDLKKKGIRVSSLMREGSVADTIITTAEEIKADVIAMSTHARKPVAQLFLGSVAENVLRHSKIPVMLIRPAKMEQKKH